MIDKKKTISSVEHNEDSISLRGRLYKQVLDSLHEYMASSHVYSSTLQEQLTSLIDQRSELYPEDDIQRLTTIMKQVDTIQKSVDALHELCLSGPVSTDEKKCLSKQKKTISVKQDEDNFSLRGRLYKQALDILHQYMANSHVDNSTLQEQLTSLINKGLHVHSEDDIQGLMTTVKQVDTIQKSVDVLHELFLSGPVSPNEKKLSEQTKKTISVEKSISSDTSLLQECVRIDTQHKELYEALSSKEIYDKLHKMLTYKLISNNMPDKQAWIKDILQSALIKAREKRDKYTPGTNILAWLQRLLYNHMVDSIRRSNKREGRHIHVDTLSTYDPLHFVASPETVDTIVDIDGDHRSIAVRNMIDTLPPEQKEVVILRHYADMSFKEIATLTRVSINTALGRMRYALINLRQQHPDMKYLWEELGEEL